jgi:hypothetical protein
METLKGNFEKCQGLSSLIVPVPVGQLPLNTRFVKF